MGGEWPSLVVFPEGTISRRQLKGFRPGVFRPGAPVQPVTLRYDDGLPEDRPGGWLTDLLFILGLLGRTSTVCELCFLPTHQPTQAECANASLFADTVRASMERSLKERALSHPLQRCVGWWWGWYWSCLGVGVAWAVL